MAKVNVVTKKVGMSHREIIKYQLMTYCFMHDIKVSNNELDCLTLLGAYGEYELSEFCVNAVTEEIFKTGQTVRNFLTRAVNKKLVIKKGTNKKRIHLSDKLQIQTTGNIMLNFNIIYAT